MTRIVIFLLFLSSFSFGFVKKEYKHVHPTGLKRDKESHRIYKERKKRAGHFRFEIPPTLPGKFNLGSKVSPPEDQGNCGSCWDFAITKALRSEYMLAGIDPGRLEFNYLLNNCSGVPDAKMMGCNGGDFPAGEGVKAVYGPGLEALNPYRAQEGACRNLPVKGTATTWNLVGDGTKPATFQELASAIWNNGEGHMLVVDLDAEDGNFQGYASGIFQGKGKNIDHMVNAIGWDCESSVDASGNCVLNAKGLPAKGDGYLIARNNWNTTWGMKGDFYIRYGANMFADTAMYFEIVKPTPVPPPVPVPPAPVPGPSNYQILLWVCVGLGILLVLVIIVGEVLLPKKMPMD